MHQHFGEEPVEKQKGKVDDEELELVEERVEEKGEEEEELEGIHSV